MGILARPLAMAGPPAHDDFWYERQAMSAAGLVVSADTAMTVSTFYACVAYIAEDVAKIPLNIFEDLGDAGHQPAPTHYLQAKLHDQPNRWQSALEFRETMTAFAMLRRFAIAEIRPGRRPLLDDEYIPLHPDLVREDILRDGDRVYHYRDPLKNFEERRLTADEVIVIRGRLGRSVIDLARDSIGLAQAQERHVGDLWRRGAKFQGAILRDKPWPDTDARSNFRKALNEYATGGQFTGRPLLLEDGMKWSDVGMKAVDAELLDSRRFSVIEGCRWFRIPPHKVFELERSTNNNIEKQSVDYVTDSLLGWTERWDQAIWRDLIVQKDRFFAEHNLDGLLKGDVKTRFEAYALAIINGWMTRNEVRKKENLNPIAGGDRVERPLNMEPLDAKRPAAAPAPTDITMLRGRLKLHASDAAARVVRREMAAVTKLAERTAGDEAAFRAGVEAFYVEHGNHVAQTLHLPEHEALRYASEHRDALIARGPSAMDGWLVEGAETLTNLATDFAMEIAA